jgi:hypothetical protein
MEEVEVSAAIAGRIRAGDASALTGRIPPGSALFKVVFDGGLVAVARATSRATATVVRGFLV